LSIPQKQSEQPPVVILVGPTAVGKTSASIPLAQRLDAEVISADSRQIYKHMSIGTAKPTPEEMQDVPHHLVDTLAPEEKYTAGQFARDAARIIEEIYVRGKQPLIVGGAGLYIKALTQGLFDKKSTDKQVRRDLQRQAETGGIQGLYEEFRRVDPAYASEVHINDEKKIIRALEIYRVTGEPPSRHFAQAEHAGLEHPCHILGLTMDRQRLYDKINRRVELMIEQGLIEEVKGLLSKGYTGDENALQTVGYQEIFAYLAGELSLEDAVNQIQTNTRHYAKRQMTWFRNQHEVTWFDLDEYSSREQLVEDMMKFIAAHPEKIQD
jgi:tRNA dimethylallyltransferase